MRQSMLLPTLLQVEMTDDDQAVHTVAFDADGGTAAGLLTLTDDDGANAFDLGLAAYDTLTDLKAAINALPEWGAQGPMGVDESITLTTAALIERDVAVANGVTDLTSQTIMRNFWLDSIDFTNDYLVIQESATLAPATAQAINVAQYDECVIECEIWAANAAAAGTVLIDVFGCNPKRSVHPSEDRMQTSWEALQDATWSTVALDDEQIEQDLAATATTHVVFHRSLDLRGWEYIKLGGITNPDAAHDLYVRAWISSDPIPPHC